MWDSAASLAPVTQSTARVHQNRGKQSKRRRPQTGVPRPGPSSPARVPAQRPGTALLDASGDPTIARPTTRGGQASSRSLEYEKYRRYREYAIRQAGHFRMPFAISTSEPSLVPASSASAARTAARATGRPVSRGVAAGGARPLPAPGAAETGDDATVAEPAALRVEEQLQKMLADATDARAAPAGASQRRERPRTALAVFRDRGGDVDEAVRRALRPTRRKRDVRPTTGGVSRVSVTLSGEEAAVDELLFGAHPLNRARDPDTGMSVTALEARNEAVVQALLEQFDFQEASFEGSVTYCQFRLQEVMRLTVDTHGDGDGDGDGPSELRAAVTCDLLKKLAMPDNRYSEVFRPLVSELSSCVYREPIDDARYVRDLLRKPTYFRQVQAQEAELQRLRSEMEDAEERSAKMEEDESKRASVLAVGMIMWQKTLVYQVFFIWRRNVQTVRLQRQALRRIFRLKRRAAEHFAKKQGLLKWRTFITSARCFVLEPEVKTLDDKMAITRERSATLTADIDRDVEALRVALQERREHKAERDKLVDKLVAQTHKLHCLAAVRQTRLLPLVWRLCEEHCRLMKTELLTVTPMNLTYVNQMCAHIPGFGSVQLDGQRDGHDETLEQRLWAVDDADIVLGWVNYHLNEDNRGAETQVVTPSMYTAQAIENLSSDLSNSEALLRLLHQVGGPAVRRRSSSALKSVDLHVRADQLCDILRAYDEECGQLVLPRNIVDGNAPDLTAAMLARMLILHVPGPDQRLKAQEDLLEAYRVGMSTATHSARLLQPIKCVENANFRMAVLMQRLEQVEQHIARGIAHTTLVSERSESSERFVSAVEQIFDSRRDFRDFSSADALAEATSADLEGGGGNGGGGGSGGGDALVVAEQQPVKGGKSGDEDWYAVLPSMLMGLWRDVCREVDMRCRAYALWDMAKTRLQGLIHRALIGRLHRTPIAVPNHRAEREFRMYTRFSVEEVRGLLDPGMTEVQMEAELETIRQVMVAAFEDLRKIYRNYTQEDVASSSSRLNMLEFAWFVRDCKCTTRDFSQAQALSCFVQAAGVAEDEATRDAVESISKRSRSAGHKKKNVTTTSIIQSRRNALQNSDEVVINAHGFVLTLMGMAAKRFAATSQPLSHKLHLLLTYHVLQNALRLDADDFRHQLKAHAFLSIFRQHRKKLRQIFFHFATSETSNMEAQWTNTLDFQEFTSMLRAAHLLKPSGPLGVEDLFVIVDNIGQQVADDGEDPQLGSGNLVKGPSVSAAAGTRTRTDTKTNTNTNVDEGGRGSVTVSGTGSGSGSTSGGVVGAGVQDHSLRESRRYSRRRSTAILDVDDMHAVLEKQEAPDTAVASVADRSGAGSTSDAALQRTRNSGKFTRFETRELLYPEFLESLAAIAAYRQPSPFVPLEDKLEYFLVSDFFPNVLPLTGVPITRGADGISPKPMVLRRISTAASATPPGSPIARMRRRTRRNSRRDSLSVSMAASGHRRARSTSDAVVVPPSIDEVGDVEEGPFTPSV